MTSHGAEPPGLANERTALAWQRTALSVVLGAMVVARLTVGRLGAGVAVVALAGLVLGGWVALEGVARYRTRRTHPVAEPAHRGGRVTLLLAGTVVLVGLTELAAILV